MYAHVNVVFLRSHYTFSWWADFWGLLATAIIIIIIIFVFLNRFCSLFFLGLRWLSPVEVLNRRPPSGSCSCSRPGADGGGGCSGRRRWLPFGVFRSNNYLHDDEGTTNRESINLTRSMTDQNCYRRILHRKLLPPHYRFDPDWNCLKLQQCTVCSPPPPSLCAI